MIKYKLSPDYEKEVDTESISCKNCFYKEFYIEQGSYFIVIICLKCSYKECIQKDKMTTHHPLIDYCICVDCKYDLPQHEAYFIENSWHCYKCYIKLLDSYSE